MGLLMGSPNGGHQLTQRPELNSLWHYGPVPRVGHTPGTGGLKCGWSYGSMAFGCQIVFKGDKDEGRSFA